MAEETPATTFEKTRGHCPKCGPGRIAEIVAEHVDSSSDENTWYEAKHRVLKCCGCETVFHQKASSFSEEYEHVENPHTGEHELEFTETLTYWPAPAARRRPDWLDEWRIEDATLYRILDETYKALDVDSRILAGIGIRTVFDRASEVLKVDPDLSFKKKLEALEEKGKIGKEERSDLEVLTDAGGAAAHRAWQPTPEQISTLMDTMENFIKRAFVMRSRIDKLKTNLPPRGSASPRPSQ
jgi:hypothetical protein